MYYWQRRERTGRTVPWAHLDDRFYGNPKILGTPLPALGLYAVGLSYCNDQLTDGFIPRSVLAGLRGWAAAARMLVQRNLWTEQPGGYQVHDYLDWNDSKEQVLAKRKGAAERQRRNRVTRDVTPHVTPDVTREKTRTSGIHPTPPHVNSRLVGRPVGPEGGLGGTNGRDLPDEVLARLAQPAIADQPTSRPGL